MKTACALALLGLIAGVANASRIPPNMADDMFSSGLRGAQGIQVGQSSLDHIVMNLGSCMWRESTYELPKIVVCCVCLAVRNSILLRAGSAVSVLEHCRHASRLDVLSVF